MTLCIGIVGGTGHAGGELARLLLNHPGVGSITPTARGGEEFDRVHPNLLGCGLSFVDAEELRRRADDLDVVFFCTPSGEAMRSAAFFLDRGVKVIDVSADFRFRDPQRYAEVYGAPHAAPHLLDEAVYGVTELHREQVAGARLVANPGCYAITTVLGLAPLLSSGLADLDIPVHLAAVNGTTGAGNKPLTEIMHAEAFGSMLPYSLEGHRHAPELENHLAPLAGRELCVDMTTAHGNFARGIYIQASLAVRPQERERIDRAALLDLYERYYADEFFVRVNSAPKKAGLNAKEYGVYPRLTAVTGSNFCHIGVDYDADRGFVKVIAVTDNLVKGAAGSAIQNMNVMFGLDERTGLCQYGL
ncbi:N-acetyl-gamma-glutamyl-phosphate reductase [Streptomyces sp. NRRL WC-3618]|uniref:N-acetyl-gamma-glutamyl-phosphate reductase n=1 Tax=Streptomyces sp. NRRL WC-3618 TaxID=1519490 RepID=UPI0006AFAD01|nr:N-acetyl-gamma-glutamyl-phosphate reductase [Streptomyces sp. NRRL WC-3618]KOV70002.1 N-acetyl-gamma-glutamyl-phosphate reductase [Streptomyces sp. NRRL WC-3618]